MFTYERSPQREAEPNQGGDGRETAKEWRGGEPSNGPEKGVHVGWCGVGEAPRDTLADRMRCDPVAVKARIDTTPGPGPDLLDTPAAGPTAIRGAAVRLVGYGISVLLGVAAMALLFRHLGVEDGGRYVTIIALVALFGGITDAGLATIAVRELTVRSGADRDSVFRSLLGIRVATALAGAVLATAFAAVAGYGLTLVIGTVLAGIGFVLQSVQLTLAAPLVTKLRQGWVAALDVARWFAFALLVAALVGLGASLLPFLAVTIPAGIIALGLTAWLVRREVPLRPTLSMAPSAALLKEALPFAIAIAVASTYFRVAVILVSLLLTAEETGYFAASYRVIEVLAVIPQLLISAAFPILARAAGTDSARFAYGVQRLFEASLLFGTWVALCLVLGAGLAIDIIAGPDFEPAATILRIQGLAMLASFIAVLWSYALLGLRRHGDLLVMTAVPLTVTTVLTVVLAVAYGTKGAAVATVIGEVTMAVVGAVLLARAAGFVPVSAAPFARVAVAGLVGAAVALIPGIPVVLDLVLATVAYFAVLLALNGIPKELLVELRGMRPSDRPVIPG
jgi:O-antigen/teichoic acid export membrane protein